MQEKLNIRLTILLAILISITTAFYFFIQSDGRLEVNKDLFRIENYTKVDRVLMETSGRKIELNYNGTTWKVNGNHDADRQLITVLFATLQQAEPKRPVASNETEAVANRLVREGVKVSLLEGGEVRKVLHAGGNPEKTLTYFYQEGDRPWVVTIPGYRIYVASILELDENGWRDKRVFNFNWRNFKTLTVTFPSDGKENFQVSQRGRYFDIVGMEADTTRLNNFLDDVSLLVGDQIISPDAFPRYDSLLTTAPMMKMVINDIANRTYELELFKGVTGDAALLGQVNGVEAMLFDRKKIFSIAKNKSYFQRRKEDNGE